MCVAGLVLAESELESVLCASLRRFQIIMSRSTATVGGKLHDSSLRHQTCTSDKGLRERFYLFLVKLLKFLLWLSNIRRA